MDPYRRPAAPDVAPLAHDEGRTDGRVEELLLGIVLAAGGVTVAWSAAGLMGQTAGITLFSLGAWTLGTASRNR